MSYLTEKLSKLSSCDRQKRRPQNCPFQSPCTQRTAQFTRQSHSSLSLPAHTTMASSQGTSVSSDPFSRWPSHDLLSFTHRTAQFTKVIPQFPQFILPTPRWHHTWRKNCVVLTGNRTGLRTVFFKSSFTHITAQFTQVIPQFPQFTCPHHDGIISRHIRFYQSIQQMNTARYIPFQMPLLTAHFTLSFLLFG